MLEMVSTRERIRFFIEWIPMAAAVPSTVAIREENTAMIRVLSSRESSSLPGEKRSLYQ